MGDSIDFKAVRFAGRSLVSGLQPLAGMTVAPRPIEGSAPPSPALFAWCRGGWDHRRGSVMMLPIVPAVLSVFLVQVMEAGTPGTRVPIGSLAHFSAVEPSDGAASRETTSGFRVVYTRRESRVIEVARFLDRLNPDLSEPDRRRLSGLLVRLGEHYGYDPSLIVAVIVTESSFDPWSRSHRGALGLMQILPSTGESLAVETRRQWSGEHTLFDPDLNISLGVRYLAQLQKRFGTLEIALTAYKYGPSRVMAWIRHGDELPLGYARRVLAHYRQFRLLAGTSAL